MKEPIRLNEPEYKVVLNEGGVFSLVGVYVAKVTYRLGFFNYIRKHEEIIMRIDGYDRISKANKYCEKLNEAEKEKYNDS